MASESEIMGGYDTGGDPYFGEYINYENNHDQEHFAGNPTGLQYQPIRNEPMGRDYHAYDFASDKAYKYNPLSTNDLKTRDLYTTPIVGKNSFSVESDFIANNTNNPKDFVVKYPNNLPYKQPGYYPSSISEHLTDKKCGCKTCMGRRGAGNMLMQNDIQHFIMFFLIIILVFVIVNQSMLSKRIDSISKMIMKIGK